MLKKLGWNEGDTLGLNGTGLSEPVSLKLMHYKVNLNFNYSKTELEF